MDFGGQSSKCVMSRNKFMEDIFETVDGVYVMDERVS